MRKETFITAGLVFIIVSVSIFGALNYKKPEILGLLNLIVLVGLAGLTGVYAYFTQKMAEEMREQRIMASRPVMIQKAMPTIVSGTTPDVFSHFEVRNQGDGPAIELQVSLLDKGKKPISVLRDTSVRAGELPVGSLQEFSFELANLPESTYYIVCEYQSIFSRLSKEQTWYQTWLPFKRCKSNQGGVRVEPDELGFEEVHTNKRIDAITKLKLSQTRSASNDS